MDKLFSKSKDWNQIIAEEDFFELLLGKDEKYFYPFDGRDRTLIKSYRWTHDRMFIIWGIFSHCNDNKIIEVGEKIFKAVDRLIKEEPFVAFSVVKAFFAKIDYHDAMRSNIDWALIYRKLGRKMLEKVAILDQFSESEMHIPEDFPGKYTMAKSSLNRYIKEIKTRYGEPD